VAIGRCLAKGSRGLAQLMEETGFSRATIFNHLKHLRGMVLEELIAVKRKGRPKLLYKLEKAIKLEPQTTSLGKVSMKFAKLKHACRFEKGGYCKEEGKACLQQTCPLIAKE